MSAPPPTGSYGFSYEQKIVSNESPKRREDPAVHRKPKSDLYDQTAHHSEILYINSKH